VGHNGQSRFINGQWLIVSYDSANKHEHYKKPLHRANQPH